MISDDQAREIQAALQTARDAADRGEDAEPLFAKAEELMTKYGGGANEPHLDADGNP